MQITLNDIPYELTISMKNKDIVIDVPMENLIDMTITNDMTVCFPMVELTIKDMYNQNFVKFIADGETTVDITGVATLYNGKNKTKMEFKHSFILEKQYPIEFNKDMSTIKYEFISTLREKWLLPIIYSTGNVYKSHTQIIYDMLTQENLNVNAKFTNNDKLTKYTSTSSDSLGEQISYLLNEATSIESGIYYVYFSLVDNEIKIFSSNDLKKNEVKTINKIGLPTSESDSNLYITAEAIYSSHDLSALDRKIYANGTREYNFDYDNRQFVMSDVKNNDIINTFSTSSDTKSYINVLKNTNQIEIQNSSEKKWGVKSRNIFKMIDNIMIQIIGFIDRDIGQTISIRSDSKAVNSRYEGNWLIFRIENKYIPGSTTFKQFLYLVRPDKKNV